MKQYEFRKVAVTVSLLILMGLSACRTCNCPAYSRDEPVRPARQTNCLADIDLRAEGNNSSQ